MEKLIIRFKVGIRKDMLYFTPSIYLHWSFNGLGQLFGCAFECHFIVFGFGFKVERNVSDIKIEL